MTIINTLPGIVPSARPQSMGRWPQKRMKMRNGRTVRWSLSPIPTGDRIALVWPNITYEQAEQLCKVWDLNYGIFAQLELPPEAFAGTDSGLASFLSSPFPGATWHFSGNPKVIPVKPGRCTVEMPIATRGYARYDA